MTCVERTDPRREASHADMAVCESGTGRALLFVHGQPGLGEDFRPVGNLLESDHRLLLPDRPGYGESGKDPVSIAENARLLAQLLDEQNVVDATVVGHSYGTAIAIVLAATRPELVSTLVLVGPVGTRESVTRLDQMLAAPVIGDALSAASLFAFGGVFPRLIPLAAFTPHPAREWLRVAVPEPHYAGTSLATGRAVSRTFGLEQRALVREIGEIEEMLPAITARTAVVEGEWDFVVPPKIAAGVAERIPRAELVIVPRVGHFVLRDAPRLVASVIRNAES